MNPANVHFGRTMRPLLSNAERWLAVLASGVLATVGRATPIEYVFVEDTNISAPASVAGNIIVDDANDTILGGDGLNVSGLIEGVTYSGLHYGIDGPVWLSSDALLGGEYFPPYYLNPDTTLFYGAAASTNSDTQLFVTEYIAPSGAVQAAYDVYGRWVPQPATPVPDLSPTAVLLAIGLAIIIGMSRYCFLNCGSAHQSNGKGL